MLSLEAGGFFYSIKSLNILKFDFLKKFLVIKNLDPDSGFNDYGYKAPNTSGPAHSWPYWLLEKLK
jgi:hypothetical protein